ncbi:MAG: hypothetical protein SVC26_03405 [Pseudomonadota bacterium]|nr:hypothetical protein [Pseudomonadota bacterium]
MLKKLSLFLLLSVTGLSHAHMAWLQKGQDGHVDAYIGEPGEPESGEYLDLISNAVVFYTEKKESATLHREADHFSTGLSADSQVVRLYSGTVWEPWVMEYADTLEFWKIVWWKQIFNSTSIPRQAGIVEARYGLADSQAILHYEIVPLNSNDYTQFQAVFKNEPLADQAIVLITPDQQEIELSTDTNGQLSLTESIDQTGTYQLASYYVVDGEDKVAGNDVQSIMYITTTTFDVAINSAPEQP